MSLKQQAKPFLFGAAVGAIALITTGFSMGWVVTSGSARATAALMSERAVKDQLVPICVHQFRFEADSASKLAKLRDLGEWQREGFVKAEGWATMPGSNSPAAGVARECAARISEIAS